MTFDEWLQNNATLYRGNNASGCMEAAWNAAQAQERERCARVLKQVDIITNAHRRREPVTKDMLDTLESLYLVQQESAAIRREEG